ncbi:MAG: NADPH-dependent assimilatory sulfite reductase hemoprotein subunit [Gemmatimonas sp.]|nr:NADPH-dependent assimilatory sulfite reductase hemoprotein subunit [Gemmatimonas sp.]
MDEAAVSEAERIKLDSLGLWGPLGEELETDSSHLSEASKQLLKFHGSYQQEDRDQRKARKKAGLEPAYSFMIRSKLPGGVLTAEQYILHDDLADQYGDATLRVTTRQGFQLYGVVKGDLRATIHDLNEALVTTFGACGDVVRNVCTCPAPHVGRNREQVIELARVLKDETLPRTRAYHDIWVDGARVTQVVEPEADPLYGEAYLPRKFKITFAFPEDNCTDVYANDLGFVVVEEGGEIVGYNVLAGGGFGQTHGKAETFPRMADHLGFVGPHEVVEVAKAAIAVQRDYGNRQKRTRARLKYLIAERGVDWFRSEVEALLGRELLPWVPVDVHGIEDHLGWHEQGNGRWFLGVFVENGRIKDLGSLRLRTALRTLVERFRPGVHLTMQHNVLLTDIAPEHREEIDRVLLEHNVLAAEAVSRARRYSMACPAIPTCPLAVAEAERVLPMVIDQLEVALARIGLTTEDLTVRMTGCPNGCARPYTADLAFVGRSLNKYVIYVGGNMEGTRLAEIYADLVPLDELVNTVRPLFERFANERRPKERFGDYWARVGIEPLPSAARLRG